MPAGPRGGMPGRLRRWTLVKGTWYQENDDTSEHQIALYLSCHSPRKSAEYRSAEDKLTGSMVFLLCMFVNAWCAKVQWRTDRWGWARLDLNRMQASLVSSVLVSLLLCSPTTKVMAMGPEKDIALFGGNE